MEQKAATGMPRGALPRGDWSMDVVFWIAFGVSALFVVAQVAFVVAFVPVMLYAYETAALQMPVLLETADALGPFGLIAVLSAIDIAVFTLFAVIARKHWQGLLFIPPLLYILIPFGLLVTGMSGAMVIFNR